MTFRFEQYENSLLSNRHDEGTIGVMTETATKLEQAIEQVGSQYYRLVILAGAPASGKTSALQSVGQKLGCQVVNVNLELSKKMLELNRTQRSRQVERLLKEVIASVPGDVVLLDNLEILFDTSLELQPLRLLQVLDRNRTIVCSWNGSFQKATLIYAEPGHPEFIQFKQPEAVVITVGKSAKD
jgi:ATPase family associated with various cellular activities (AAA)